VSGESKRVKSEALLVSGEWRVEPISQFAWPLVIWGKGKGERVKQKKGWVETGDVDRGKGKEEQGKCLLVFHFSRNREIRPIFTFFTG
jgi:hypothetical protein